MVKEKAPAKTLDYASAPPKRRPLRERIDLQFWTLLTILILFLLWDLSCIAGLIEIRLE